MGSLLTSALLGLGGRMGVTLLHNVDAGVDVGLNAAEDAVHETARLLGAAKRLGKLDALVDGDRGGHLVNVEDFEQGDAQQVAVRGRDARRPTL